MILNAILECESNFHVCFDKAIVYDLHRQLGVGRESNCTIEYKQDSWFVVFVAILYISILQMSFSYLFNVI